MKNHKTKIIIALSLILIGIPSSIYTFKEYGPRTDMGDLSFIRNKITEMSLSKGEPITDVMNKFEGCWFCTDSDGYSLNNARRYSISHKEDISRSNIIYIKYDSKSKNHNAAWFELKVQNGKLFSHKYIPD